MEFERDSSLDEALAIWMKCEIERNPPGTFSIPEESTEQVFADAFRRHNPFWLKPPYIVGEVHVVQLVHFNKDDLDQAAPRRLVDYGCRSPREFLDEKKAEHERHGKEGCDEARCSLVRVAKIGSSPRVAGPLVAVANFGSGYYTVIDGNHRLAAWYLHQQAGNMYPICAFLISTRPPQKSPENIDLSRTQSSHC